MAGLSIVLALLFFSTASARVGVGIGLGKIKVNEEMKAGAIYELPSLPVLNTGDEVSNYKITVQYHEGQEQRSDMGQKPGEDWFIFSPDTFSLEPNGSMMVDISLSVPLKAIPGNYFAYLEAHPVQISEAGKTSIGIAAASKLYFTISPSNIFQGVYYRFISLYSKYHPWDTVVASVIFLALIIRFVGKKFKFKIEKT